MVLQRISRKKDGKEGREKRGLPLRLRFDMRRETAGEKEERRIPPPASSGGGEEGERRKGRTL